MAAWEEGERTTGAVAAADFATLGFSGPTSPLSLVGGVWAGDAIGWRTMGGVVTWPDPTMGRTVT